MVEVELDYILLMEETSCRQKSQALWLKEGDKYTKCFHKLAKSLHKNNTINALHVGDSIITDKNAI